MNKYIFSGLCLLTLSSCVSLNTNIKDEDFENNIINQNINTNELNNLSTQTNDKYIELSLKDAILLALERNKDLEIKKITPLIKQTFEEQYSVMFSPSLGASLSLQEGNNTNVLLAGSAPSLTDNISGKITWQKSFPLGTNLSLEASLYAPNIFSYTNNRYNSSRIGLSLTQPLMQNWGEDFNLVLIRGANYDTLISEYELKGFVQTLVSDVEETYWDYVLTRKKLEIYENSLKIAGKQLKETEQRVKIGKLAESEIIASQAEVAQREQDLLNAQKNLEITILKFLRLINHQDKNTDDKIVILSDEPQIPAIELTDIQEHIQKALKLRPDINQAQLSIKRGDIEIVKTKNGLLPKLDWFVTLGKSGYADSFGQSLLNIGGPNYDLSTGLSFGMPVNNTDVKAIYKRALLNQKSTLKALENLSSLIETDMRSAYVTVNTTKKQINSAIITRKLQEKKLETENAKFREGKSTSLLVAQTQRDLLSSQIAEIEYTINYLKALVAFYLMEGTLLDYHEIIISF